MSFSTRSMRTRLIFRSLSISSRSWPPSSTPPPVGAGASAWLSTSASIGVMGRSDGDRGEGLVEVHSGELFAIGAKADDIIGGENVAGEMLRLRFFEGQAAVYAIEADHQGGGPEAFVHALKESTEIGQDRFGLR